MLTFARRASAGVEVDTYYLDAFGNSWVVNYNHGAPACKGHWRIQGMGYQMRMPVMLNIKWARATWREFTESETKEAMMAVRSVQKDEWADEVNRAYEYIIDIFDELEKAIV